MSTLKAVNVPNRSNFTVSFLGYRLNMTKTESLFFWISIHAESIGNV